MTLLQKEIFKAHLRAFLDGTFGKEEPKNAEQLREFLLSGKTHFGLWQSIIENNVSITSQLMMSSGHISKTASKQIRVGFKKILTTLNII